MWSNYVALLALVCIVHSAHLQSHLPSRPHLCPSWAARLRPARAAETPDAVEKISHVRFFVRVWISIILKLQNPNCACWRLSSLHQKYFKDCNFGWRQVRFSHEASRCEPHLLAAFFHFFKRPSTTILDRDSDLAAVLLGVVHFFAANYLISFGLKVTRAGWPMK